MRRLLPVRLLPLLFGAIILAGSAQAQPCRNNEPQECQRNHLASGITIDMSRADVMAIAEKRAWTPLESSRDTLRYRDESESNQIAWPPYVANYTVSFKNGRARGVAARWTAAAGREKRVTQVLNDMWREMLSWCGTVRIDTARAFITHSSRDGRTVKTSWNRIGPVEAVIEVAVADTPVAPEALK